jgi:predicted site-specific integrase-resolvase
LRARRHKETFFISFVRRYCSRLGWCWPPLLPSYKKFIETIGAHDIAGVEGAVNIGYARVSVEGQSLESQLEQLGNAGCSKIFSEKASGTRSDRPELHNLVKSLQRGAVVVVTRLDRLARSTDTQRPSGHRNSQQKSKWRIGSLLSTILSRFGRTRFQGCFCTAT